jgi:prepilin-type N-terminal cleavage/methylation domain-containing protein
MKRNRARRHASAADGFSLIELMISLVIVVIVFAIAMQAMVEMVQRKSVETNKMDLVQESREFMDQITNDIHQSGYPSYKMFDYASPTLIAQLPMACPAGVAYQMYVGTSTAIPLPAANACPPNVAVGAGKGTNGLMSITQSSVQFEADVDGTGVSEVFIQLVQNNGANAQACTTPPCVMQRGTILKQSWLGGGTVYYYTELNNVMNTNVFTAFDNTGTAVALPATTQAALLNVTDVGITIYVRAPSPDPKTGIFPTATMISDAKIRLD